jgi:hypothetical protein
MGKCVFRQNDGNIIIKTHLGFAVHPEKVGFGWFKLEDVNLYLESKCKSMFKTCCFYAPLEPSTWEQYPLENCVNDE